MAPVSRQQGIQAETRRQTEQHLCHHHLSHWTLKESHPCVGIAKAVSIFDEDISTASMPASLTSLLQASCHAWQRLNIQYIKDT